MQPPAAPPGQGRWLSPELLGLGEGSAAQLIVCDAQGLDDAVTALVGLARARPPTLMDGGRRDRGRSGSCVEHRPAERRPHHRPQYPARCSSLWPWS